jgi:hypothetical protein
LRAYPKAPGGCFFSIWLCLIGTAASCDAPKMPPLATVARISPEIIEPGEVIRIEGDGFVEGSAEITFKGKFKPAGLVVSKDRTVHLNGTAVSGSLVEVPVSSSAMRQITAEQTRFEGKIEISFPSAAALDAVRIIAAKDGVSLEFRPTGNGVPLASLRSREAARFLKSLGLVFPPSDSGDGLVVKELVKSGSADRAGVGAGDRLLAVNGTALAELGDLAGLATAKSYKFEFVSRSGTLREVDLGPDPGSNLDPDEFTAIMLSSIALGLFLAFAAPTGRRLIRSNAGSLDPFAKAICFGAISVPLLLIPAGSVLSSAGVGASLALLGTSILGLTGMAVFDKGPLAGRLLRFFAHLMAVPAVMAVAGASGSTIGLWDIVASQETSTWGWHVWSSPFALAAVLAGLSLLWPSQQHGSSKNRVIIIATWLAAVPAAGITAACCLGGWLIPGVPVDRIAQNGWLLVFGCLIFCLKTWIVLLIARGIAAYDFVERRSQARGTGLRWRFVALHAAVALSLIWIWVDMPSAYRLTGQVLATAASVTFFTVLSILGLKQAGQSFGKI